VKEISIESNSDVISVAPCTKSAVSLTVTAISEGVRGGVCTLPQESVFGEGASGLSGGFGGCFFRAIRGKDRRLASLEKRESADERQRQQAVSCCLAARTMLTSGKLRGRKQALEERREGGLDRWVRSRSA